MLDGQGGSLTKPFEAAFAELGSRMIDASEGYIVETLRQRFGNPHCRGQETKEPVSEAGDSLALVMLQSCLKY